MASNYPTWGTWDNHAYPAKGYYWGDDPVGPRMGQGFQYEILDHGPFLVIQRPWRDVPPHRVTMPRCNQFWWSSELPSLEWWQERNAMRRREIADEDGIKAITDGSESKVPSEPMGLFRQMGKMPMGHHRRMAIERETLAQERARTMPINHDHYRHPLQGKPKGSESEYSWLLDSVLYAVQWVEGAIVYNEDGHRAAMIRIKHIQIMHGPSVPVIAVNDQIFQWDMDGRYIMHIITEAQGMGGKVATVYREEAGAQPAPGQAEDNVVIKLDCGHVMDLTFDPAERTAFYCNPCGGYKTRVFHTGGSNPYATPPEPPVGYMQKLTCGHYRLLGKKAEVSDVIRCFDCNPNDGELRSPDFSR